MTMEKVCENCQNAWRAEHQYCALCGAEVIEGRITTKKLWKKAFSKMFGWENRVAYTLGQLLIESSSIEGDED